MAHSVRITVRALREIDEALEWLSGQSRAAAVRWHGQLLEAIRSLENNPERRTPMFKHLTLTRPLAVIDLETTGTDPQTDRIVEVSVLKVYPDGVTRAWHG